MSQQYSNWCFTVNNYTLLDDQTLQDMPYKYLIYGREVGEEGTPHLQGYVQYKKKLRLSALKKLHPTAHWEPAKGTQEQNKTYCSKEGDFQEFGTPTKTNGGASTIADRAEKNARLMTAPIEELILTGELHPQHAKAIHNARILVQEERRQLRPPDALDGDLPHLWFWGPAGTGKSFKARTDYPDAYLKAANKWWCGYNDEDTVLIEEWDKNHNVLAHHLKLWADRYPFSGEVKGGTTGKIRPKRIVITSNYHPRDIWGDDPEGALGPIMRRFNVVHFDEKFNYKT